MLFNKELIDYPSKGILEDAINRRTLTPDAYSPISSEIYNEREIMLNTSSHAYTKIDWDNFPKCIGHTDFSYNVLFNQWQAQEFEDLDLSDIKEFKPEVVDMARQYCKIILVRWLKSEANGYASVKHDTVGAVIRRDNSDNEMLVSLDELTVMDESETEYAEKTQKAAVRRLIYLLKLIQECSIQKNVSVLQLLILHAKYGDNGTIAAKSGIYKVNSSGHLLQKYADTFNTTPGYKDLWNFITLKEEDPFWTPILKDFLTVCGTLGLQLKDEEVELYTPEFLDSFICDYLESNEEFVENIGKVDRSVIDMLTPDKLFSIMGASDVSFTDDFMFKVDMDVYVQNYIEWREQEKALSENFDVMMKRRRQNKGSIVSALLNDHKRMELGFILVASIRASKVYDSSFEDMLIKTKREYYYDDDGILCVYDTEQGVLKQVKLRGDSITGALKKKCPFSVAKVTKEGFLISSSARNLTEFLMVDLQEVLTSGAEFPTPSCRSL